MAKKKKQKKAGLAKRQQNKVQKRNSLKKKLHGQKTTEPKKMSMNKIKKVLKNLPYLAFEPELQNISFNESELQRAIKEHEKEPDRIEALVTPEFKEKLLTGLNELEVRVKAEGDSKLHIMATTIIYFMNQEDSPAYLNQVIVAIYFRDLTKLEKPETIPDKGELCQLVLDYDKNWADYFKEKFDDIQEGLEDDEEGIPGTERVDETIDDDEEEELLASPFEDLVEEFEVYLKKEFADREDEAETIAEDVEVLLNDYFVEKELSSIVDITGGRVKNFLTGWFVRNMHPTAEDLEKMIKSIEVFTNFLRDNQKLSEDGCSEIFEILKNKDKIVTQLDQ